MQFLEALRRTTSLLKVYSNPAFEAHAEAMFERYADQQFSFVDAVSFAVMCERGIDTAFAFD